MENLQIDISSERKTLENLALMVVPPEYYYELYDNIENETDEALILIVEAFL